MIIRIILIVILSQFILSETNAQSTIGLRIENIIDLYINNTDSKYELLFNGDDKRPVYNIGSKLIFDINEKLILGIGISYHQRPIKELCAYWVTENDTLLQLVPGPIFNYEICSHKTSGTIRYVETPIVIGYYIFSKEGFKISSELEWNPLYRLKSKIIYNPTGDREEMETRNLNSDRKTWKTHGVNINLKKDLNSNWNLVTGIRFKSDDFSYERIRFGINVGIEYQIGI